MSRIQLRSGVIPTAWVVSVAAILLACSADRWMPSSPANPPADSPEKLNSARHRAAPPEQGATASEPTIPDRPDAGPSEILARGQALFARQCVICHGEAGDGAGKFAYLMNPRPRNFKAGKFKLSTTQNQIPSDDDLLRTISRGMPGSAMPPWGHLPLADLKALAAYVRSVHVNAVKAELAEGVKDGTYKAEEVAEALAAKTTPGAAIVVPPEPEMDDLRWFNGRRVYIEACAACHGINGEPVPENVKFDEEGYPDPPRSFVNGIFKGGMEGAQLYCRIMKGMRGTPMPAYEGTYSNDEIGDLIHYVQTLARNGAQDRAQLRQSTIVAPNIHGSLPGSPKDPAWNQTRPVYVAMTPLWWTPDRIEGAVVQALHNDTELALRLTWIDATQDDRAVRVDEFRDAVAIQFSMSSDPPFYMGDKTGHGGVNIWMWKADRQKNIDSGYQDVDAAFPQGATDMYAECPIRSNPPSPPLAKGGSGGAAKGGSSGVAEGGSGGVADWPHGKLAEHNPLFISAWGAGNLVADPTLQTPVECLVARGPGTLTGKPANLQIVQGQAVYDRGVWSVQLQRTLELPHEHGGNGEQDERAFKAGDYLPMSIAVWNGSAGDRDGKKNISIWQKLVIE